MLSYRFMRNLRKTILFISICKNQPKYESKSQYKMQFDFCTEISMQSEIGHFGE